MVVYMPVSLCMFCAMNALNRSVVYINVAEVYVHLSYICTFTYMHTVCAWISHVAYVYIV